jgi:hypothetical protein
MAHRRSLISQGGMMVFDVAAVMTGMASMTVESD